MTPSDVRDLFNQGRKAKHDLDVLRAQRERLRSGLPNGGMPTATTGGGVSDPTGRAANILVDMLDEWQRDEERLSATVNDCRALCEGIGRALGTETKIVLECHYLMEMEWKLVAACVGRSLTTVYALSRAACEYVAFVGPAAAREGIGRAAE